MALIQEIHRSCLLLRKSEEGSGHNSCTQRLYVFTMSLQRLHDVLTTFHSATPLELICTEVIFSLRVSCLHLHDRYATDLSLAWE